MFPSSRPGIRQCEFDTTALFFDLGHGMGRPSMHAAALHPHIAASFGTEFNPQLYKQSMHVLLDTAQKIPCLCVRTPPGGRGLVACDGRVIFLVFSWTPTGRPARVFHGRQHQRHGQLQPVRGRVGFTARGRCSPPLPRFTHIYAFNIGMPEDVIDHMFDAIVKSATVKYAIM